MPRRYGGDAAALTIDANLACRVDLSVSFDAALPFVGSGATLRASVQCVDGGAPPPGILFRWEPHPEIEFDPHEGPVANARARFLIPGPTRLWVAALVPDGDRWVTLAESDPVEIEVVESVLSLEALPTTATVGQRTSVQASFDPPIRTSEVTLAWTVAQAVNDLEESEDGGTLVFTPRTAVLHEVRAQAYLTELGDAIGEAVLWVPALPAGPGPAGDLHGRAAAGDTVAQALLGKFHLKRDAGEADRAEAVRWLTQAAEGGDTSAQRMLGFCLVYGRGVAKDEAAGLRWIERARQGGDDHAPYLLAALEDRVDASPEQVARVRALLQEAAARGSAAAMHGLGTLYERGRSTSVDYAEAARWYLAAAQAGHAEGQRMAGRFLLVGLGVTKDRVRGLDLLRRAAQQGGAEAQLELAEALGPGTAEGRGWLERAARQGEADAAEALGRVYLTGDGTPADASLAARWLQRAADAPFAGSAALALAALYERGEGVNRDLGLALYYYRRASEGIVWRSGGGEDGVARAQERVRALRSASR